MKINTRNIIAWAIKLGTLGYNLPATMGVAISVVELVSGTKYDTFNSYDRVLALVSIISGIVVVDSVFLAAWYDLDTNKSQDDSDKIADAVTVVIMYVITILIGILHGEGLAGVLFRVPMGIAVARSTWKTISYSIRRGAEGGKAGTPLLVRWEQIKAITRKGVETIQYDLTNYVEELGAQLEVIRAHRQARTEAGKDIVIDMKPIYREQAVASAKSNNISMTQLPSLTSGVKTITPTILPVDSSNTNKTNGNYSVHYDGKEWIATCLHPGCTEVRRGTTEVQAKRQIVGHGNAHRVRKSSEEIVVSVPEIVEEPTLVDVPPTADPQPEEDETTTSRFQNATNTGEF